MPSAADAAGPGGAEAAWVRGRCPLCGDFVVSNTYYIDGRGYLIAWECAASLSEPVTCDYRRIL